MPVLDFKGKSVIYSHHLGVPFRPLEVDAKKSFSDKKKKPSLDDNLIIHGDNLHALKALLPRYSGKIKCIYIDPPYNTGNEKWVFNDNVNNPSIKEWLGKEVGLEDLERHDKWLCMMWPRLQLLKELLSDDGVIFISIDDNEQHRLRLIMDEIFGEENCIAQIIAQTNPRGRSLRDDIAQTHEYILIFSKDKAKSEIMEIPKPSKTIKEYNKVDEKGKFRLLRLRNSGIQFFNKKTRPNLYFPIYINPVNGKTSLEQTDVYTVKVYPKNSSGKEGCWTWSKDKITENSDMIVGAKTNGNNWRVYRKDYLPETGGTTKEKSLWIDKSINHEVGKERLKDLFQESCPFEFPKSHELIKKCINLVADKDSIVLDSFAGSGTTAHAVLDLNKEDNGNRKFILVECEDYADKVTAERVRRVIKGVPTAKNEKLKKGLCGSFTYCTIGNEISEENLIKGKSLPSYKNLASYVYYTATGSTLDQVRENTNFYVGKSDKNTAFFVIYKPDLKFLRSQESALNLSRKEQIQKVMKKESVQKAIVFAPVHYFESADELASDGIIFCQLPFAIYKIAGA